MDSIIFTAENQWFTIKISNVFYFEMEKFKQLLMINQNEN